MKPDRLDQTLQAAINAGLLPADSVRAEQENRPWPVVLLTALGAWLAAIPLLIVVGVLIGDMVQRGVGPYLVGLLVLALAVMLLRAPRLSLFVEQLGVPALIVGACTLGFGLFRDLPNQAAAAALVLVIGMLVFAIPRAWLRVLLGAAAAVFTELALLPQSWNFFDRGELGSIWLALHLLLAIWLAAMWLQRQGLQTGTRARVAAALESLGVGWLLVILAGLAFWSGMTFLVGASVGGNLAHGIMRELGPRGGGIGIVLQLTSAVLAVAASAWLQYVWPALRQAWCAGVALVLIALCWLMPSLGAVLLALAVCLSGRRWRVAAAAGLVAAWIIGAFYYQLHWSLADKALFMVAAAAALGSLTWFSMRQARPDSRTPASDAAQQPSALTRKRQAGIGLGALLVLLVANGAIWQKEDLIAHGQPIYVALAPADPRSLMQGDFMRLNFSIPRAITNQADSSLAGARPHAIARRDARGIATLLRVDDGSVLGSDELRIELTPKNRDWVLVTDAWFFKEGDGARWAAARYGEFRVGTDGRALLVGLRGEDLQRL